MFHHAHQKKHAYTHARTKTHRSRSPRKKHQRPTYIAGPLPLSVGVPRSAPVRWQKRTKLPSFSRHRARICVARFVLPKERRQKRETRQSPRLWSGKSPMHKSTPYFFSEKYIHAPSPTPATELGGRFSLVEKLEGFDSPAHIAPKGRKGALSKL